MDFLTSTTTTCMPLLPLTHKTSENTPLLLTRSSKNNTNVPPVPTSTRHKTLALISFLLICCALLITYTSQHTLSQALHIEAQPSDSLPRFPSRSPLGLLRLADYIFTVGFAHSGAFFASSAGMQLPGTVIIGIITALGGGTCRDAIILSKPPFWTLETEYIYLAIAASLITFVLAQRPPAFWERLMEGVDVLGTGVFCVLGCMSASREKNEAIICVLCGVLTATFGGLTRDVLCRQEVGLLHSKAEILGRSAVAGGSAYLAIAACGGDVALRVWGGVAVSVCVRAWEWTRFIDLPPWFSTKEVL